MNDVCTLKIGNAKDINAKDINAVDIKTTNKNTNKILARIIY